MVGTGNYITKINTLIGNNFIWFILSALALALIFSGFFSPVSNLSNFLLFFMMLSASLQCCIKDFVRIWEYPKEIFLAICFIYGIIPLFNSGIAYLFFQSSPQLGAGQILIAAIPPGITSSIWTGLAGGNVPFSITIIFLSNLISFFATPGIMHLFAGKAIHFDAIGLMWQLTAIVIIPVIIGTAAKEFLPNTVGKIYRPFNLLSKIALIVLLLGNTAAIAPYIFHLRGHLFLVVIAVGIQCTFGFGLAYIVTAKILRKETGKVFAFTYTSGMRNNGAAVVIALNYFGPIVAIPVVINTLFQQPIASLIHKICAIKN